MGYEVYDVFEEYCKHIKEKYNSIPGFITQNIPRLKNRLEKWGIENVVICGSINKIGYLMSPDLDSYLTCIAKNNKNKYQIMAMSTMASGAIPAKEAFDFINQLDIQSVVFGASSKLHIDQSVSLLNN